MLQDKELLVLMFHHVHGKATPYLDGLYGPDQQQFKQYLQTVGSKYIYISYSQLKAYFEGVGDIPEKSALVTFDDGTVDNYLNAFPVLKEMGIPAIFFVITACAQQRILSPVQTRHLLVKHIGDAKFTEAFLEDIIYRGLDINKMLNEISAEKYKNAYRWDTEETARLKYLINFSLDAELRNDIILSLFNKYVGDAAEWGDRVYMRWENMREMIAGGMTIGGHSHMHEPLGIMPVEKMQADIADCALLLKENLKQNNFPFSYPFGKKEHFSEEVINQLRNNGFDMAFTNIQGINHFSAGQYMDVYRIARIDPKDINTYLAN